MWHFNAGVAVFVSFRLFFKLVFITRSFSKWREFNGQLDLHIGDTKTDRKQSEKKKTTPNDEFNEILRIEYKFYVNVTELIFVYCILNSSISTIVRSI